MSTKLTLAATSLGWKMRSDFHITGLYKDQEESIMVCGSLVTTEKVLTMSLFSLASKGCADEVSHFQFFLLCRWYEIQAVQDCRITLLASQSGSEL